MVVLKRLHAFLRDLDHRVWRSDAFAHNGDFMSVEVLDLRREASQCIAQSDSHVGKKVIPSTLEL